MLIDIIDSYLQGYYDTMDAGYMDEEGYLYVMSRVDDVINVAGHRISAGAIEEVLINIGLLFQVVFRDRGELKLILRSSHCTWKITMPFIGSRG